MTVKLIRHGETDWSLGNRIQGQKQVPLNKKGIFQAEKLAEDLRLVQIDEIFSSDLKRSLQAAEIISQKFQRPIMQLSGLREISYGCWEGKLWADVYRDNPYLNNSWQSFGMKFSSPGGETALEFRNRVIDTFQTIITNTGSKNLIIVTHAQVIRIILACFKKVKDSEIFTFIDLKHCCVKTISTEQIEVFKEKYRKTIECK